MKILAISDRPPKQGILTTLSQQPIDLIVTLGDFDQMMLKELAEVHDVPKIGVYGNHDSGMYMEPLGIANMHMATWEYQGVTFGGFEGSVRYKQNPHAKMYTQEEASMMLSAFPHVDVMLVHCPPYGINDEPDQLTHQGFKGLRDYVEREHPAYLFHGHTYPSEATMVRTMGSTKIEYVYSDRVIDLVLPV